MHLLEGDCDHALERLPDGRAAPGSHPIIVTATDFGDGPVIRCPFCNRSTPLRREWLEHGGATITCPQDRCEGLLKVNPFIAGPHHGPWGHGRWDLRHYHPIPYGATVSLSPRSERVRDLNEGAAWL